MIRKNKVVCIGLILHGNLIKKLEESRGYEPSSDHVARLLTLWRKRLDFLHIFMSSGLYDPIVSKQETDNLIDLFKKVGAKVSQYWQNSGHELRMDEIKRAREWLSNIAFS
ncbi:MAG: hypothetical protein WBP64_02580 [Nitrososphaeraceae archaeon]